MRPQDQEQLAQKPQADRKRPDLTLPRRRRYFLAVCEPFRHASTRPLHRLKDDPDDFIGPCPCQFDAGACPGPVHLLRRAGLAATPADSQAVW